MSTGKLHCHHVVPRSKGGSDDPSNLVWLSPYDHALHHALDYLEGGLEFDCRQEGWKLLPEDLREQVRKEKSRRMSKMREGKGNSLSNRQAVSKRHRGVPKSETQRKKTSEALKGKPKSEETKAKLKEAWVERRKRPVSPETREKMRQAHLKRWAKLKEPNEPPT